MNAKQTAATILADILPAVSGALARRETAIAFKSPMGDNLIGRTPFTRRQMSDAVGAAATASLAQAATLGLGSDSAPDVARAIANNAAMALAFAIEE